MQRIDRVKPRRLKRNPTSTPLDARKENVLPSFGDVSSLGNPRQSVEMSSSAFETSSIRDMFRFKKRRTKAKSFKTVQRPATQRQPVSSDPKRSTGSRPRVSKAKGIGKKALKDITNQPDSGIDISRSGRLAGARQQREIATDCEVGTGAKRRGYLYGSFLKKPSSLRVRELVDEAMDSYETIGTGSPSEDDSLCSVSSTENRQCPESERGIEPGRVEPAAVTANPQTSCERVGEEETPEAPLIAAIEPAAVSTGADTGVESSGPGKTLQGFKLGQTDTYQQTAAECAVNHDARKVFRADNLFQSLPTDAPASRGERGQRRQELHRESTQRGKVVSDEEHADSEETRSSKEKLSKEAAHGIFRSVVEPPVGFVEHIHLRARGLDGEIVPVDYLALAAEGIKFVDAPFEIFQDDLVKNASAYASTVEAPIVRRRKVALLYKQPSKVKPKTGDIPCRKDKVDSVFKRPVARNHIPLSERRSNIVSNGVGCGTAVKFREPGSAYPSTSTPFDSPVATTPQVLSSHFRNASPVGEIRNNSKSDEQSAFRNPERNDHPTFSNPKRNDQSVFRNSGKNDQLGNTARDNQTESCRPARNNQSVFHNSARNEQLVSCNLVRHGQLEFHNPTRNGQLECHKPARNNDQLEFRNPTRNGLLECHNPARNNDQLECRNPARNDQSAFGIEVARTYGKGFRFRLEDKENARWEEFRKQSPWNPGAERTLESVDCSSKVGDQSEDFLFATLPVLGDNCPVDRTAPVDDILLAVCNVIRKKKKDGGKKPRKRRVRHGKDEYVYSQKELDLFRHLDEVEKTELEVEKIKTRRGLFYL